MESVIDIEQFERTHLKKDSQEVLSLAVSVGGAGNFEVRQPM